MITIDGSQGEGGGQILRTALALSLATGTAFRIENIRGRRPKPGLLRQHLTALNAAAEIGGVELEGARLGATEITFRPAQVRPGRYKFAIGSAGSTTLVLQTVLPPLLTASGPSHLELEGGTHNPAAPPFDFLRRAFLPLIARMGPRVEARLERAGFYPAGGGRMVVEITPVNRLTPLELPERGAIRSKRARAIVVNLPAHIAERELRVVQRRMGWPPDSCQLEELPAGPGPGNALSLEVQSEHITEVFTGFGEHDVSAEMVAQRATDEVRQYLASTVPVGTHLADQLLVPMVLAGSGMFRSQPLTRHATTNIEIIGKFLDLPIQVERDDANQVVVRIG